MRYASLAAVAGLLATAALAPLAAQDTAQTTANDPAPMSAAEANTWAGTGQPVTTTVPGGPGQPDKIVTTYPGNLKPPPPTSLRKTYPPCRGGLRDNCQNPGEGGAPGRSRAADPG